MAYLCQRDLNTFSEKIDLIRAAYPNWSPFNGEKSKLYTKLKIYVELQTIKNLMHTRSWSDVYCKIRSNNTIMHELVIQLERRDWLAIEIKEQKQIVKEQILKYSEQVFDTEYYADTNQIRYLLPPVQSAFSEHIGYLFWLKHSISDITRSINKFNDRAVTLKQNQTLAKAKEILQGELDPLFLILSA